MKIVFCESSRLRTSDTCMPLVNEIERPVCVTNGQYDDFVYGASIAKTHCRPERNVGRVRRIWQWQYAAERADKKPGKQSQGKEYSNRESFSNNFNDHAPGQ